MSAMKFTGLALLSCCLLMVGCSGAKETNTSTTGGSGITKPPAAKEHVKITDTVLGKGDRAAAKGDILYVLYKGTLKNGTMFETNMGPDKDVLAFVIGNGDVIAGWEEGFLGMKVGGKRKLHIPSSLAYGPNGNEKIPANADLDFDVELLGLIKVGEDNVVDHQEIKPGSGARTVKDGDKITIRYVGKLLNGKVFDDESSKPYTFTVGKGETLSCIDEGVKGMKVGGVRKLICPPATAYAIKPTEGVPPNSEVVFEIQLVKIG
jgi:FKBP-type peptidyl-prolyl cis-trans isomerase